MGATHGDSVPTTTSAAWWEETRRLEETLVAWLFDQFRGEATAAERIRMLAARFSPGACDKRAFRILQVIARQEEKHAQWVGRLLAARGFLPRVDAVEPRYWREPLGAITDFHTGCAVGAHAEKMRLERIEVIAQDDAAPLDVREVFARILVEERFHERAFRTLAGEPAMQATKDAHERGRTALGLSA